MCSPEEAKAISNSRGFPTSPSCSLAIQRQLHSLCHRRRGGGLLESSHPLWLQAPSQKVLLPSPCPARASKWQVPVFFPCMPLKYSVRVKVPAQRNLAGNQPLAAGPPPGPGRKMYLPYITKCQQQWFQQAIHSNGPEAIQMLTSINAL